MSPLRRPLLNDEKGLEDVNKLEYYIPLRIPPEVLAYDSKLDQLGVGKAGKLGGLILGLEADKVTGKTSVKQQYSRVPLYTQRALYLEEALPCMAYMYIISPSGGILQGDRYRMDITLRNNALAHLTTQGATRIYRMEKNFATQIVNISVGEGCYLEYVPDQIIPYRDSRFYQIASLRVHDTATLVYSEMVTPGRVASGEHFEYDICYMKAVGTNQNDIIRFYDVAILEPKIRNMGAFGILEKYDVFGTVYVLTETKHLSELNEKINRELQSISGIYGGASMLPGNSGLLVRLLGTTANDLRTAMFEVVRSVRKAVLNAPFSGIRKG
ncbi:MAG: urease accessory protein UreD [Nitrososphaerales archaeon]